MPPFKELNLSDIRTYSAADRKSLVHTSHEAAPPEKGMTFREFLDNLPGLLKADDLKAAADAVIEAKSRNKPVIVMLGGHVIKTGCSPILIDLAKKGFITHLASNGAAAIHDTELARFGTTSENVAESLEDGSFGMAEDTAILVNNAARKASEGGKGFGETVGEELLKEAPPFIGRALIACAHQLGIPYTLHVALGTDIVHQHPSADGAAIGDASLRDFRIFASSVSGIGNGGVVLNLGSAVIMPEVFLKALSVSRNLCGDITNFTTVNVDMIQHYRPNVNVVRRPVIPGGKGYAITGHHEIMVPMLAAAIYERTDS